MASTGNQEDSEGGKVLVNPDAFDSSMEGGRLGDGTKLPDDPAELLISAERLAMFEKELEDSAASQGLVFVKPDSAVLMNLMIGLRGPHFWYASAEGEKFDEFGRKLVRGGFTEDDDISAEDKAIRLAKLRELAEEYKANGRKFLEKPDASKSSTEGGVSGAGKKLVSAEEKAILFAKFNKALDDYDKYRVNPPDEYKAAYKTYIEMERGASEARREERLARWMDEDITVSMMEKIKMFTKDLEARPVRVPANPDARKWGRMQLYRCLPMIPSAILKKLEEALLKLEVMLKSVVYVYDICFISCIVDSVCLNMIAIVHILLKTRLHLVYQHTCCF